MRIFLASAGVNSEYSHIAEFRRLASVSRSRRHALVESPSQADAVLFVECHQLPDDWTLSAIRRSELARQFRGKAFVYDERDRPWCALPGLYTSMPRSAFRASWMASVPYFHVTDPSSLVASEPASPPDLLFSFVGSRTHPCRNEVFRLEHPRGDVRPVDGFLFHDPGSRDFRRRRRDFAQSLQRSAFVLCPRGHGTSSIRLYETLAAGRVPVVISDDWVPPRGPDWDDIAIRWPEADIARLPMWLERIEGEAAERGRLARTCYESWYAPDVMFDRLMDDLERLYVRTQGRWFPPSGIRDRNYVHLASARLAGRGRARIREASVRRSVPLPHSTGSAPQRIAIAASSYAPHKGGVEELVRQLAIEQRSEGGEPLVMTMRWPKSLPSTEVIEGTRVRRFLYRSPEGGIKRRAIALAALPVTVASVALELRRSKAQVVHIQCVSSAAWFVGTAARILRLPLVVTMQGELTMDATGIYERSAFLRWTLRGLLRRADAVTACSGATLREAEEWAGIDLGSRGSVIYNGVRLSDFAAGEPATRDRPYVLAVGRHVEQKGFDVLLDAYALLLGDGGFEWDLVLAGDGPEHSTLREMADALEIADRVAFLGATDRSITADLFKGCAVFVLPSRHEPFGIVNLEAMAAGKPVVATAVGGVPEFVIEDESGLLVRPEDPIGLAESIRWFHDHPDSAAAFGHRARLRAEQFDWSKISAQYNELYRSVSGRSRRVARS